MHNYLPGPFSSSFADTEGKVCTTPYAIQFTLVAERVRPRSSGVLSLRTPPSNRLAFASVAPGAQAPPLNPAKLGFQPALLQVHPAPPTSTVSARAVGNHPRGEEVASRHLPPTVSLNSIDSVRFGCLPDTKHKDGVPQEPRAHGHQQRRRQCSLC